MVRVRAPSCPNSFFPFFLKIHKSLELKYLGDKIPTVQFLWSKFLLSKFHLELRYYFLLSKFLRYNFHPKLRYNFLQSKFLRWKGIRYKVPRSKLLRSKFRQPLYPANAVPSSSNESWKLNTRQSSIYPTFHHQCHEDCARFSPMSGVFTPGLTTQES